VQIAPPQELRAVPGFGAEGQVDGCRVLIGSLRWLRELAAGPEEFLALAQERQAQGATVSVLAVQADAARPPLAVALLVFGDEPKPSAPAAIECLRAAGVRAVMISGDNRAAAEAMARRLGLNPEAGEVLAEVLPGDKAEAVRRLQGGAPAAGPLPRQATAPSGGSAPRAAGERGGHIVGMVGDGVNDAPALAAADVGIAMGNGADAAMHAAAVTLMRGDVALVPAALDISRRTVAKIRQNLFWAFVYNVAGIPLAALGYLSPVVAGAAMALSSVSVMGNALLLRRWRPERAAD